MLTSERPTEDQRESAPIAARVAGGLLSPGGPTLLRRALEGALADEGSRVVELQGALGSAAADLAETVRTWTVVEEDAVAAERLRSTLGRAVTVVEAPPSATGIAAGAASIVLLNGVLSGRDDAAAATLLAEAARLLRPAGRVVIIDPIPRSGQGDDPRISALDESGVRVRQPAELRALVTAAGLAPVGETDGPLRMDAPLDLARRIGRIGPRSGLQLARSAVDARVWHAATRRRQALEAAQPVLRAGVVVAERPLVLGLLRQR